MKTVKPPTTQPRPLRIAMVAACPFPSLRGSQVLIRGLAQSLADRGHVVHLVTYPQREPMAAIRGVRVHYAPVPWVALHKAHWGWRRVLLDLSLAWTLYGVVRRAGIQVMHAHNYEAPLASFPVRWMTRIPIVYHAHNALGDELAYYFAPGWRHRLARSVGRLLDRQVPRRADFSIALTPELAGFLRSCGAANVATISPTSAAGPLPAAATGRERGTADGFVVMYTGNLDPYQDLEVLWAAIATLRATLPHTRLRLVTHEANWEERAGAALVRLRDAGAADVIVAPTFSAVRRLMASADVLVCPRRSWSGFPIKLINYMVSGKPVVVAAGSAKGVIDGETGLVFRNGDATDLAAVLSRLAADPQLRVRLGDQARQAIAALHETRARNRQLDQIEAVYASVRSAAAVRRSAGDRVKETWSQGLIAFSKDRISAVSSRGTGF